MSLRREVEKLEGRAEALINPEETPSEQRERVWWERWDAAYLQIISTMRPDHAAKVDAEIAAMFETSGGTISMLSLLAEEVHGLAVMTAQHGTADGPLAMPPALAEMLIEHEQRRLAEEEWPPEGWAEHWHRCADCWASYPALHKSPDGSSMDHFFAKPRKFYEVCVLCGGAVKDEYE